MREKRWLHPVRGIGRGSRWARFFALAMVILIGGVFIAVALFGEHPDGSNAKMPPLAWGMAGVALALLSVWIIVRVARRSSLRSRPARVIDPFLADHPWDPRGETTTGLGPLLRATWWLLLSSLLVPALLWLVFESEGGSLLGKGMGIALLLLVPFLFFRFLLAFARMFRYGRVDLVFESFPFFLGGEVDATLRRSTAAAFRKVHLTLRCIQEEPEDRASVCYAIHEEKRTIHEDEGAAAPGTDLPVRFPIPEDGKPTELAAEFPRYWEIEVEGENPGPNFVATFLVPIYARP